MAAVSQKEKDMIERRNREWDEAQHRKKALAKAGKSAQLRIPESDVGKTWTRLKYLTDTIRRWNTQGFEVAKHLQEVRDDRLYEVQYETFEEYCLKEFKWQRRHAYAIASWADVSDSLSPELAQSIQTESQARALSVVKESKRDAVVKRVLKSDEPFTAKSITQATKPQERKPKKKKKAPVVIDVEPEPKPAIKNHITLDIAECLVCETETLCLIKDAVRYCEPCISAAFESGKVGR